MPDNDGWQEWSRYVLKELERLNEKMEDIASKAEMKALEKAFTQYKENELSLATRLAVAEKRLDDHSRNWDRMWKYAIGVILAAVVVAILASIGLGGLP